MTPLAVKIIIPEPMTKRFEVKSLVLARSASNDSGTDYETARRAVLMRLGNCTTSTVYGFCYDLFMLKPLELNTK